MDEVFSKLVEKSKDRNIFIPLSAGYDSRLILSCLLRHGHKKISCYSYGLKNNSEMQIAKAICNRLNIPIKLINTSPRIIRNYSKTNHFKKFLYFADNFCSTPFVQDLPALSIFLQKNKLSADTIFINGNTGDFISGGHIPEGFKSNISLKKGLNKLISTFAAKHFSLWDRVTQDPYKSIIENRIKKLVELKLEKNNFNNIVDLYESLEWEERQSKFVVTGQRVYDFLGYDWRLPLWELPIKVFFENLSFVDKFEQNFYKKVLYDLNWSNIWREFPLNSKKVYPIWVRPIRYFLQGLHLPLGKNKWHKFEKKYFEYWTSYISTYALVPFFDTLKYDDSFRSVVSLRTARYLESFGLDRFGGKEFTN